MTFGFGHSSYIMCKAASARGHLLSFNLIVFFHKVTSLLYLAHTHVYWQKNTYLQRQQHWTFKLDWYTTNVIDTNHSIHTFKVGLGSHVLVNTSPRIGTILHAMASHGVPYVLVSLWDNPLLHTVVVQERAVALDSHWVLRLSRCNRGARSPLPVWHKSHGKYRYARVSKSNFRPGPSWALYQESEAGLYRFPIDALLFKFSVKVSPILMPYTSHL